MPLFPAVTLVLLGAISLASSPFVPEYLFLFFSQVPTQGPAVSRIF